MSSLFTNNTILHYDLYQDLMRFSCFAFQRIKKSLLKILFGKHKIIFFDS